MFDSLALLGSQNQRCTASFRAIFQFSRPVSGMGVLLNLVEFSGASWSHFTISFVETILLFDISESHGNQNMVEDFSNILSMNVSDFPKPTWDTLSELSSFRASQGSCLTTSLSPLSSPPFYDWSTAHLWSICYSVFWSVASSPSRSGSLR